MSAADFLAKEKSLAADVVIYPFTEIGSLVERRLIRGFPESWLDRPDYHKPDLFELPELHETAWGEKTYAVPLGSPVLVCFYRPDVFEKLGRQPPKTWTDYQELVEFFAGHDKSKTPTIQGLPQFCHARTARSRLGWQHAAGPCCRIRQASRLLFHAL